MEGEKRKLRLKIWEGKKDATNLIADLKAKIGKMAILGRNMEISLEYCIRPERNLI